MSGHITVKEFAKATGLSELTVRKMVWNRELPSAHFGRAVRIPTEALNRYIERNTTPALEP